MLERGEFARLELQYPSQRDVGNDDVSYGDNILRINHGEAYI